MFASLALLIIPSDADRHKYRLQYQIQTLKPEDFQSDGSCTGKEDDALCGYYNKALIQVKRLDVVPQKVNYNFTDVINGTTTVQSVYSGMFSITKVNMTIFAKMDGDKGWIEPTNWLHASKFEFNQQQICKVGVDQNIDSVGGIFGYTMAKMHLDPFSSCSLKQNEETTLKQTSQVLFIDSILAGGYDHTRLLSRAFGKLDGTDKEVLLFEQTSGVDSPEPPKKLENQPKPTPAAPTDDQQEDQPKPAAPADDLLA